LHITSSDGTSETLSDIDAELTGRRRGVIAGKGMLKARGQRLHFDGSLTQIADKATPHRWPAKLSVKGRLLEASFEGLLDAAEDLQISGQTEISTPSIRRAARWFGVPIPTPWVSTPQHSRDSSPGLAAAWPSRRQDHASTATRQAARWLSTSRASAAGRRHAGLQRLDLTPYREALRSQSFVFERTDVVLVGIRFFLPHPQIFRRRPARFRAEDCHERLRLWPWSRRFTVRSAR
jgi:hypothetical protein